jgi:hypothetical protein
MIACSNHWRESGSKITAQEVASIISEIEQSQAMAGGAGNLSEALALKDDPNASVYYADAYPSAKDRPAPVGAVPNILGFFNFEFLGKPELGYKDISEARVLFFDAPQESGPRKASIIIGMKTDGNDTFTYYSWIGEGSIEGDNYEAFLEGGSGEPIIVKSFDVESGLATVIQLKVYASGGSYLGKIATLIGFKY